MSVFVGQDFDCEFTPNPNQTDLQRPFPTISCLSGIMPQDVKNVYVYEDWVWLAHNGATYQVCRPRLNHWHFNDGTMKLPDGLVVEVLCANGNKLKAHTEVGHKGLLIHCGDGTQTLWEYGWAKDGAFIGHNIVAVKILGLAPGYEHPGMEVLPKKEA